MTPSRQLVFSGKMPWVLRAVAALLIPVNLMAAVPMNIVVAALSPSPPPLSVDQGLLQPPASAFAQQPASFTPHPPAIPKFDPPSADSQLSTLSSHLNNPTDRELITSRCFEEPLAPQPGDPLPGENADLARALMAYRHNRQDLSPLTDFLDQHPDSRWKASLLTNLGLLYRHEGRWSRALAAFEAAWSLGKNATNPLLKAIVDRALGELAQLHAGLGHTERLEALLKESAGRDVRGPGTERFNSACSNLWSMKNQPDLAFRCGPLAVGQIFQLLRPNADNTGPRTIHELKSTAKGTDLATLVNLMNRVGLDFQVAFRTPGAPVLVPSIIHWKAGHYSALTKRVSACPEPVERDSGSQLSALSSRPSDQYLSQDRTFGVDTLVSTETLDEEASGYFLVPAGTLPPGWRAVGMDEARTIFGKGYAPPANTPPPPCVAPTAKDCPPCHGMAAYNFEQSSVTLMLMDTPVGYTPPVGPDMKFTAHYNHREQADMTYISNLGNKWSFDWLNYIEAPSTATVVSFGPGGGQLSYSGFSSSSVGGGTFATQLLTQNTLVQNPDGTYTMNHPDGTQEIFGVSDGTHILRTKYIDPQGNTIIYSYDSNYRLVTVKDALNQITVLSYGNSTDPTSPAFYNITKVTDPFGRFATFAYNGAGELTSITDVLGLTSSFTYGEGDFVTSLTTPYGTTQFAAGDVDQYHRWLEATDPLGAKERLEFNGFGDDPVPNADTVAPAGFANEYLAGRDAFYWDKKAMEEYVPGDYSKAKITHFLHDPNGSPIAPVIESVKQPFEGRVWYAYAGLGTSFSFSEGTTSYVGTGATYYASTANEPTEVSRILDDGTEQDYRYQYNTNGNKTQSIDPLGRETDYVYDTNQVDLLQVKQKNGSGYDLLATYTYNTQHEPLTAVDASGQKTTYTYNAAGQVSTITDAKNEVTEFFYDPAGAANTTDSTKIGYLVSVVGPVAGAITLFTYDGFGRLQAVTDSEGYTVTAAYDVFDRPTKVTYPDGTFNQILYNLLDAEWTQDRLGRWTHQLHDALRHLVVMEDPLSRKTLYDWCNCGALEGITDPAGNTTTWIRDAQSRVTSKIYPDGTSLNYAYENTTSRLKSVTDAKSQVTNYQYNLDNSLAQVSYANAQVPTPTVSYTYDPIYLRIASMTDGTGATNYSYNPVVAGTLGSGLLGSVTGPLPNSTISYTYDQLGRVTNTSINDPGAIANASSVVYDPLGRVTSATNLLGTFGYGYLDQTARLSSVSYPNGQATNYSYYPNSAATPGNDDQRLSQIQNLTPSAANLSTFGYGYNAVGLITSWSKQSDAATALVSDFQYDPADQLIAASVPSVSSVVQNYAYQYDLAGNRTSEQIDPSVTGSSFNNLNQLTGQSPGGSMVFTGTVNKPATVTLAGQPAAVDSSNNWRGMANVTVGANAIPLVATDLDNSAATTTKTINITVSGGAARTLTFDANGNLTNDGNGKAYAYDARNRMISVTQTINGVQTVTGYVYDGHGHRVQETSNGTVVKQWVWCPGDDQPCEERDGSNNVTKRFYDFGEQINGTAYFATLDHLGSVREMTNSAGGLIARYDYDPFGRRTLVSGTDLSDFGFTHFYYDQASGLWFSRTRAYDPNLGRWLNRDPLGERGGINLYAYVENNPINSFDPTGKVAGVDDAIEGDAALVGWAVAAGVGAFAAWKMEGQSEIALQDFLNRLHARQEAQKEQQAQSKKCDQSPSTPPAPPNDDDDDDDDGPPCFAVGTLVSTPDGEKKIEDIKAGDTVYTYDFKLGQTVEHKVTAALRHFTYYWVDVQIGSETIRATRAHPFWVENEKRWVAAVDLKAGMLVRLRYGTTAMVTGTVLHELTQPETTYNLAVETDHDYFVGDLQVLVHNGSGSYTITFQSGKVYVGKGDAGRAADSAQRISEQYNDPAVKTDWTPANGDQDSFVQEEMRMRAEGGPGGNTYNEINSPGNKIANQNDPCP